MLKEEIKKKCLEDADLFADLCATTGKIPNACLQFLNRNSSIELRSYEVVGVIKKHTGLTEEDILNPISFHPTKKGHTQIAKIILDTGIFKR